MSFKSFDRSLDVNGIIPKDEPDHVKGIMDGISYIVKRNRYSGSLLGYVRVPKNHPWYKILSKRGYKPELRKSAFSWTRQQWAAKRTYSDLPCSEVHGGLTYSGRLGYKGYTCRGLWIGFDCNHYQDLSPSRQHSSLGGMYRDLSFVMRNIAIMVKEMKDAAHKS
jgi:hypothetical protein